MESGATVISSGGPFNVTLLQGELCVLSLPLSRVPSIAWWILREYVYESESSFKRKYSTTFSSIIIGEDCLSVVCSPAEVAVLQSLNSTDLNISAQRWKALVINVVGSAAEFPGAVYFLADILSNENISILHISTFESEIFLVQDENIEVACQLLQSENIQKLPGYLRRNAGSSSGDRLDKIVSSDADGLTEVQKKVSVDTKKFKDGFMLSALPNSVMLARLSEDFKLSRCGDILAKMFLYDERFCSLERELVNRRATPSLDFAMLADGNERTQKKFMWGLWRCENEVTLLLEEADVDRFPEGSLIVSPQSWRVIKLAGRPIDYDETGIVCAMSQIETDVPTLNISTAITNCTLVPNDRLDATLDQLSKALQCPVEMVKHT